MFPDAVLCWQFELDFHPTHRKWTTDKGDAGPWEAAFRGNRRFGRGGTGRAVFPLCALLPESTKGLIGAQKNLGYTSIVSSSCRLHDQSIHAGQAAGAVAAVSLRKGAAPEKPLTCPLSGRRCSIQNMEFPWPSGRSRTSILSIRTSRCFSNWRRTRVLGLSASDTAFLPDQPAHQDWVDRVVSTVKERGYQFLKPIELPLTRRELARLVWAELEGQPVPASHFQQAIPWQADPARDGLPGARCVGL